MKNRFLIPILCALFACFIAKPVSAFEFSSHSKININNVTVQGATRSSYGYFDSGARILATPNSGIFRLYLSVDSSCPANSLVYVTGSVSNANYNFTPIAPNGNASWSPLWSSISGDNQNYTFSSLFYAPSTGWPTIHLWGPISNENLSTRLNNNVWDMTISDPQCITLSKSISDSDLNTIKNDLSGILSNTSDTNDVLDAIRSYVVEIDTRVLEVRNAVLNAGDSVVEQEQATTEAIEAQTEQDQQDRQDLSAQQSAADDSAADSGDEAEEAGTSLLSAVSSFVGVLTSASPSDCVIDMDLGNLDMGNVDLCQLSPPQPIPTIASIMLISFFVPLSWATATRMIGLFRSFTG